eukprot:gene10542-11679_t
MGGSVSSTAEKIVLNGPGRTNDQGDEKNCCPGQSLGERDLLVRLLLPLYYTSEPLTEEENEAAIVVWKMIVRNQSVAFSAYKATHPETAEVKSVSELLHLIFYERLFLIHPSCRGLFLRSMNKMNLVPMISLCLSKLDTPNSLATSLTNLVIVHNRLGVKAAEYGMVGEVLMHAIKECVGPKEYSPAAHRGWCKIISILLATIVPEVVKYELSSSSRQTNARRALMAQNTLQSSETLTPFAMSSATFASTVA